MLCRCAATHAFAFHFIKMVVEVNTNDVDGGMEGWMEEEVVKRGVGVE